MNSSITESPPPGADPSGGNGGSNKDILTSDMNSSITESPPPGAPQVQAYKLRVHATSVQE